MRFLGRAVFVFFLLLGALIAISNRQPVELRLWPLLDTLVLPLFLLVPALLLLGVLAGLLLGWIASGRHRRRAREHAAEASRLQREIAQLKAARPEPAAAPARAPSATVAAISTADARSLERQAALVDPDAVVAARRIR
jgi:uncharacterized integral membrane protein